MTTIEWTEKTWNPVRGCSRVSPGCDNCYAMRQAHRFSGPGKPFEGLTTIRRGKVDWSGRVRFVPKMLDVPLRRRAPTVWFVNSMSDLFHESLSNEEIAAVFGVMAACPRHTFQVLTKRTKRMREWFEQLPMDHYWHIAGAADEATGGLVRAPEIREWPLPNCWLGVSAEDQQRADERIPHLLATPAAVSFVSAEPLLGPIDFDLPRCEVHDREFADETGFWCQECAADGWSGEMSYGHWLDPLNGGIDWVIVGGESGPNARIFDMAHARAIREQCEEAGVAFFMKQAGSTAIDTDWRGLSPLTLRAKKGEDPEEWPHDLRIREAP